MPSWQHVERDFFRRLNAIVEPAVRKGVASSRWAPGSLIVLETVGFKTGRQRRTPLLAVRLGKHLLVSTARGNRSFWAKNVEKSPQVAYYLGGKRHHSRALLLGSGENREDHPGLLRYVPGLGSLLQLYTSRGWAFALLEPVELTGNVPA